MWNSKSWQLRELVWLAFGSMILVVLHGFVGGRVSTDQPFVSCERHRRCRPGGRH